MIFRTDRAASYGPGAQLRGGRPRPPEAPEFRGQTLPEADSNALCHSSCSASLGGASVGTRVDGYDEV